MLILDACFWGTAVRYVRTRAQFKRIAACSCITFYMYVMLRKAQRKILGGRVYANPECMFLGNGSAICKNMSAVQKNCCVFVYNILHVCARGTAVRYV